MALAATGQSWQILMTTKQQLSLSLFLLLNALSAFFTILVSIQSAIQLLLPIILILIASLALFGLQLMNKKVLVNHNVASLFLGMLWALHLLISDTIGSSDITSLETSLMSILFISAISFLNNIVSFLLHSLPVTFAVLWLISADRWLQVLYSIAVPIVGISIQHIIHKHREQFTQLAIKRLVEEKETLNDLSMLDPLTGLYNRRGFQNRLDRIQAPSVGCHYILLLDVDYFKCYNDNFGHAMGDQALIRISAAIRDTIRSRDVVCRFGGEEFIVMITNVDDKLALQAAERIRQHVYDLNILNILNNNVINVSVSIGIAPVIGGNTEQAISLADTALYQVKNQGRNASKLLSDYNKENVNPIQKLSQHQQR